MTNPEQRREDRQDQLEMRKEGEGELARLGNESRSSQKRGKRQDEKENEQDS